MGTLYGFRLPDLSLLASYRKTLPLVLSLSSSRVSASVSSRFLFFSLESSWARMYEWMCSMHRSMSYVTLLAQVYDKNETLRQAKHNYWQVLFVVGIFFGSLLSYFMTNSLYGSRYSTYTRMASYFALITVELPMLPSLVGGILLLMGSKMMRGCTRYDFGRFVDLSSAQGLSGMPLMCFPSMIATCFIFVGGISTCLLTKYFA